MKTVSRIAALLAALLSSPALSAPADCSKAVVPATPVKGMVGSTPFVVSETRLDITRDGMEVDGKKFDKYTLSVMAGGIFNELTVSMLVPLGGKADGRTFRVLPTDSIHDQPAAAPGLPEVQGWDLELEAADVDTSFTQTTASIRVEWGTRQGASLPGKIYFCVPSARAEIMGTFTASVH